MKEKSLLVKVLRGVGIAVSVTIVVLAVLQLAGVFEDADSVYMPGVALLMFIQAAEIWKNNRHTAIFSLFAGVFVLAVVGIHFFLR